MKRIVLIDNNPVSFLCQPRNGIPVASWYEDPQDRVLESTLALLAELEPLPDVRPRLDQIFGLSSHLAQHRRRVLPDEPEDEAEG